MFRRLIPILFSVLLALPALAGQSWVTPNIWVDLGRRSSRSPQRRGRASIRSRAPRHRPTPARRRWSAARRSAVAATMTFAGTQHVFAIGLPGALQVQVDAEAVVAAASTPAIASDGGGMAHITNWPSVFAVTWSGQSVAISNWPATQVVSWSGQSIAISNWPTMQAVSLAAGSNTVGNIGVNNNPVGSRGVRDIACVDRNHGRANRGRAHRRPRDRPYRRDAIQLRVGDRVHWRERRHRDDRPAVAGRRRFHDQHHGGGLWRRRVGHANRRRPGELLMRFKSSVKRPLKALEWVRPYWRAKARRKGPRAPRAVSMARLIRPRRRPRHRPRRRPVRPAARGSIPRHQ